MAVIKNLIFDMFTISPAIVTHRNFAKTIIFFDLYCVNKMKKNESISFAFMLISDKNEHHHFESLVSMFLIHHFTHVQVPKKKHV